MSIHYNLLQTVYLQKAGDFTNLIAVLGLTLSTFHIVSFTCFWVYLQFSMFEMFEVWNRMTSVF